MIIRQTTYARAGLVGNPSDIFHGRTVAFLFDHFSARVTIYDTPSLCVMPGQRDINSFESLEDLVRYRRRFGYYGGMRLIEATIVQFYRACSDLGIKLSAGNFTVEYESDIPFAVGLGGSAAIVGATLAALMRFYGITDASIPRSEQPGIMLAAETEELEISAGLQDRVVMAYGGLVYMDFTEEAFARNNGRHGLYEPLDLRLLPPLFVAYSQSLSKPSGKVHNPMRYRAEVDRDPAVLRAMTEKADVARQVRDLLVAGRGAEIGPLLSRDYDLRRSVYSISPENDRMIKIARDCGTHANFAGSGGAVVGLCETEAQMQTLRSAYETAGYTVVKARPVEYKDRSP